MKKVVLLLLAVIFCYTAFAAGDPVSAKVVNVSSSLNIREQPSKQSSVVGKIGRGETVQVLTSSMDGWIQVQYGGVTGKRHWNGDIEGENGKWYESELNDTVTEKKIS